MKKTTQTIKYSTYKNGKYVKVNDSYNASTKEIDVYKRLYDLVEIPFEDKKIKCKIYIEDYDGIKVLQDFYARMFVFINKNEFSEKFNRYKECDSFMNKVIDEEFNDYEVLEENVEIDEDDMPFGVYSYHAIFSEELPIKEINEQKHNMIYEFIGK